jgi:hypothetical protein
MQARESIESPSTKTERKRPQFGWVHIFSPVFLLLSHVHLRSCTECVATQKHDVHPQERTSTLPRDPENSLLTGTPDTAQNSVLDIIWTSVSVSQCPRCANTRHKNGEVESLVARHSPH